MDHAEATLLLKSCKHLAYKLAEYGWSNYQPTETEDNQLTSFYEELCAGGVSFLALAAENGLKRQHVIRLTAAAIKASMARAGIPFNPETLEHSIFNILPDRQLLPELLD